MNIIFHLYIYIRVVLAFAAAFTYHKRTDLSHEEFFNDNLTYMDDIEEEQTPPLYLIDGLKELFGSFDAHDCLVMMEEEDLEAIEALSMIFNQNSGKLSIKEIYEGKNGTAIAIISLNHFQNCFCMPPDHFDIFLDYICKCKAITVDFAQLAKSTVEIILFLLRSFWQWYWV